MTFGGVGKPMYVNAVARERCNIMRIAHVSATQLNMFARCQAGWMFSYVHNIKGKPSGAMTRGTCVHKGISHNMIQKVESRVDLPVADVLDHYDATFTELSYDTSWKKDEKPGKEKDAGYRVLGHYQKTIAPETYPADVEQSFKMFINWTENGGEDNEEQKSVEFRGILDLADVKGNLVEIKTTGQTPKRPRGADGLQLTGYYLGKEALEGKSYSPWLDYLVTTKDPKILSFPIRIEEPQKKFFLDNVPRIVKAMELENYYPARGSMYCSPTGCYYWDMCHDEFGG